MARSMSVGMAPSSSSFSSCDARLPVMRLPTKPSQFPTTTFSLPMRLPTSWAVAIAAMEDALPRTISSSRMMLAGERKCIPTTSSGRLVAEAMASTSSVDVLLASTTPGRANSSSLANSAFLAAMSSKIASTTKSASRTTSRLVEPCNRARRFSNSA